MPPFDGQLHHMAEAGPDADGTKGKSDGAIANRIFVGKLPYSCDTIKLRDYFRKFGVVEDAHVKIREDGSSRGFGYVTFRDEASAARALETENTIDGQWVPVQSAQPKGSPKGEGNPTRKLNRKLKMSDWKIKTFHALN